MTVALHISRRIYHKIVIFGTHVYNDDLQMFFSEGKN